MTSTNFPIYRRQREGKGGHISTYRLARDSVSLLGPGKGTGIGGFGLPRASGMCVGVVRNPRLNWLGLSISSRLGCPTRNLLYGTIVLHCRGKYLQKIWGRKGKSGYMKMMQICTEGGGGVDR